MGDNRLMFPAGVSLVVRAVSLAAALATVALSSAPARACTCGTPTQGAAALAEGNGIVTIFEGRLDRAAEVDPRAWSEDVSPPVPIPTVRFDYTVIRWWKADPGARVSVLAPRDMYAGCGRRLPTPTDSYLVYAASKPSVAPLVDGPCSATKALAAASPPSQELAELGPAEAPRAPSLAPPPPDAAGETSGCSLSGAPAAAPPPWVLVVPLVLLPLRGSAVSARAGRRRGCRAPHPTAMLAPSDWR
jgi:hypothetical protein